MGPPRKDATMKTTLFAVAYSGYLMFGLLQIAASACGLQHLTGLWWLFCWIASFLVGWTPVLGTALGIYGAHVQWDWSLPASFALFLGVPALLLVLLTVSLWSASSDTGEGATLRPSVGE